MKRVISFILVAMMLVALMPFSVLAAGTVTITKQPTDQYVYVGEDAEFSLSAEVRNGSSGSELRYIWFDAAAVDLDNMSFAKKVSTLLQKTIGSNATLTINNVTAAQDGMKVCCAVYSLKDVSLVISNEATLHVSVMDPCDEHMLTFNEAKDETCCSDGNLAYYSCRVCHRVYLDEACEIEVTMALVNVPADPNAHDMEHHERKEPTCKDDGNIEYWQCSYCGNRYANEEGTGDPLRLKDIEIDNDDAGHKLTLVPAKESTCTVKGNKEYYVCDVCGDYFNATGELEYSKSDVEKPLLPHTTAYAWDSNTHWKYCTKCESIMENTTAFHNDKNGKATCISKAVCECGCEHGDINPDNHVNTELRNFKEATTKNPGYTGDVYCLDCKQIVEYGHVSDQLCAHNLQHFDAVDPGCENCENGGVGYKEYWYCDKCERYFSDEKAETEISVDDITIPAYKHYITIPISGTQIANLTVQQYAHDNTGHWRECKYCHYVYADTFGVHNMLNDAKPTCCTGHSCLVCGYDDGQRDPEKHIGGTELIGAYEPEGKNPGYTGDTVCKGCGEILQKGWEYYPKCSDGKCADRLKHIDAVPSDCYNDGTLEHWQCKKCGNIYMDAKGTVDGTPQSIVDKCTGHEFHPGTDLFETVNVLTIASKLGWTTDDLLELVISGNLSDIKNITIDDLLDNVTIKDIDHCHDATHHWLGCQKCGLSLADLREEFEKEGIFIDEKWYELSEKEEHSGGTATCSQKAVCAICGDEYGELGTHRYDKVVTEPTCTEPGSIRYKCNGCELEQTERREDFPALGHQFVKGVCSRCGARSSNPFWDVSNKDDYYTAIMWAYTYEPQITSGTDATHFSPKSPCNRGQVVTFLWRAAGRPEPASSNNPFVDVQNYGSCQPFYKAILWAAEQGITNGTDATHFSPGKTVTRAEFVTFLWRYFGKPASTGSIYVFNDAGSIATPFRDAVAWAVERGITGGYQDNTFRPNTVCNRWQVVMFMYRAIGEGKAF